MCTKFQFYSVSQINIIIFNKKSKKKKVNFFLKWQEPVHKVALQSFGSISCGSMTIIQIKNQSGIFFYREHLCTLLIIQFVFVVFWVSILTSNNSSRYSNAITISPWLYALSYLDNQHLKYKDH